MSHPPQTPPKPDGEAASAPPSKPRRRVLLVLKIGLGIIAGWLILAYLVLPALWRHYEHQPKMAEAPKVTLTAQGIPGDPLNVGLIGTESEVVTAMLAAGWDPADPITLRSSLRIAESVVLRRPDPNAPVSSLYLFGRKQDLAFEKPVGQDARRRHHVRYWKAAELGGADHPVYLGSATFDTSVGLSRDTGQITHHIAPDIDAQRDELIADLVGTGRVLELFQVTGVGATLYGRNGEGDRYFTDGELSMARLSADGSKAGATERLANPPLVRLKDQFWDAIRPYLKGPTP